MGGGAALAKLAQMTHTKSSIGSSKIGESANLTEIEEQVAERAIEKTRRKEKEVEANRLADEYERKKAKMKEDADKQKAEKEMKRKADEEKRKKAKMKEDADK